MTDEKRASEIKALLEERASAEARGRSDLVAQIDDQLHRRGAEGTSPVKRAAKRPARRAEEVRIG